MTDYVLMEQRSTRLSLAVSLLDDYSGVRPAGSVELSLDDVKPVVNPGGYYLFLDLADGSYTLKVQADYYFSQEQVVTVPVNGSPKTELALKPAPAYPFPRGATLIRGMVKNTGGQPVPGATIEVVSKGIENKTTEKGDFVLYFKNLTEDDVIKSGGKTYVKGNGNKNIKVKVTHPDYHNKTVPTEVEESTTVSLQIKITEKGG